MARDKLKWKDKQLFIFDMYNRSIWPNDSHAKQGINVDRSFASGCGDEAYLKMLEEGLAESFKLCSPDIVMFNAGTDVLVGDPLGGCKVPTLVLLWKISVCETLR